MPFEPYLPDDSGLTTEQAYDLYVLREALRCIQRPFGWCRGRMDGPGDSHCAVGWIVHLTGGSAWMEGEWQRIVHEHLVANLPLYMRWRPMSSRWRTMSSPERVYAFNDMHGRDAVIGLFRRAIARIECQRRVTVSA